MEDERSNTKTEQILEEYVMYVNLVDSSSDRRLTTNRFYVSILSLLLISIPFIGETSVLSRWPTIFGLALISVFSIILSIGWYFSIRSYQELSSRKFAVVKEMENELPFQCYTREEEYHPEGGLFYRAFHRQSVVEQLVPISIVVLHVILLAIYVIATWL